MIFLHAEIAANQDVNKKLVFLPKDVWKEEDMSFWIKICSLIILLFLSPLAPTINLLSILEVLKKGADLERYDDLSSCKKLAEQTVLTHRIK